MLARERERTRENGCALDFCALRPQRFLRVGFLRRRARVRVGFLRPSLTVSAVFKDSLAACVANVHLHVHRTYKPSMRFSMAHDVVPC